MEVAWKWLKKTYFYIDLKKVSHILIYEKITFFQKSIKEQTVNYRANYIFSKTHKETKLKRNL